MTPQEEALQLFRAHVEIDEGLKPIPTGELLAMFEEEARRQLESEQMSGYRVHAHMHYAIPDTLCCAVGNNKVEFTAGINLHAIRPINRANKNNVMHHMKERLALAVRFLKIESEKNQS